MQLICTTSTDATSSWDAEIYTSVGLSACDVSIFDRLFPQYPGFTTKFQIPFSCDVDS
jgi:hypothetical protein